jgi:hypothetical protein
MIGGMLAEGRGWEDARRRRKTPFWAVGYAAIETRIASYPARVSTASLKIPGLVTTDGETKWAIQIKRVRRTRRSTGQVGWSYCAMKATEERKRRKKQME